VGKQIRFAQVGERKQHTQGLTEAARADEETSTMGACGSQAQSRVRQPSCHHITTQQHQSR